MKKLILASMFFLLAHASFAREELQLGVILGAPTGMSAKLSLGNNRSVDAALAYSLSKDLGLEFHADYLIEKAQSFYINAPEPLELYFGIGLRLAEIDRGKYDNDVAIGPRAPVGVTYTISNPNLQFFGELALILNVVPDTDVDLDAGLGVRYRF
ncbi:MAG: hypothetical protein HOP07_15410 [Bacteriovoracaceae bacterium]|nr:hypothetical protein [Bacteriovoracaceae bacterium]